MAIEESAPRPDKGYSLFYDPKVRGFVFQALMVVLLVALVSWIATNTYTNLRRANIASGFDFLGARSGFDISQTLISYTTDSTYFRAFLVGLLNTLLVAGLGVVLASVVGLLVGIARLSKNWLVAKLATIYVETLRNIPLLLLLLFWYKAVLSVLPSPRQSFTLPFGSFLSNRGLTLPATQFQPGAGWTLLAFIAAIVFVIGLAFWANRRRMATGKPFPTLWVSLVALIGFPIAVFYATGSPLNLNFPELRGFNFVGGFNIHPEFLALLLGLSLYTASFIAEVVRGGILAISNGQTEAAYALGFRPGRTLRLIIIPQALRVIIPPLTNQYLNLIKNSSLAVAIGYPDLVSVFSGTVMNQTGQAVEVIAITMGVYLLISLITSAFMNWFNSRIALKER